MTPLWPVDISPISTQEMEALVTQASPAFNTICTQQKITSDLTPYLSSLYIPFANWLFNKHANTNGTLIVGINGAQGSGKTTLSLLLANILKTAYNANVVTLSIDDIYKTRLERQQMAHDIHPLFQTRGVPGTHDTSLGIQLLTDFKKLKSGEAMSYPVFDKGNDDRAQKKNWPNCRGVIDIILFEGWCVGARPQKVSQLEKSVNVLEAEEDKTGKWRTTVNNHLKNDYKKLFNLLDCLVFLKIPNFSSILKWRELQEQKLINHQQHEQHLMTSSESLQRFINHYERLTRHQLKGLPKLADLTIDIGTDHQAEKVSFKRC